MSKSLVIGELDKLEFKKNEELIVIENYYKDFYQSKNIRNDISIAKPYLDSQKDKKIAFEECEKIYLNILGDISKSLNKLHKIKLTIRSWEIIFGNWLRFFVWLCFERYNNLNSIFKRNQIEKVYFSKNNEFIFSNNKTSDISYSSIDEQWNNNLYLKIFEYLEISKNENIKVSIKNHDLKLKERLLFEKKTYFKESFFKKILNLFSILRTNNDGVILNTYLPPLYEKILEILFLQTPKKWEFKEIVFKNHDSIIRSKIDIRKDNSKNLENFIRKQIQNFLPISIIESFQDIITMSKNAGLPKNPKFIFTSNDFESNEIFKFYTAILLMKKNIPYIIGQHGNSYFTDLRNDKYRSEFNFSNKFLTWGYSKQPKFKGLFNFSSYGRKKYKPSNKKKLLIVVSPLEFKLFPFDTIEQTEIGFKNVINILDFLNKKILQNTTIRLHNSYYSKRGDYYLKKYFKSKSLQIDMGQKSFPIARSAARLSFFNYDSTGILENLALNFPTVCLWDNIKSNINDKFFYKYELLIDAKILFLNKNDLADHLNNVWDNIDGWWLSKTTQEKIKKFNENFNIQGDFHSLFKLKKICLEKNEKNIL